MIYKLTYCSLFVVIILFSISCNNVSEDVVEPKEKVLSLDYLIVSLLNSNKEVSNEFVEEIKIVSDTLNEKRIFIKDEIDLSETDFNYSLIGKHDFYSRIDQRNSVKLEICVANCDSVFVNGIRADLFILNNELELAYADFDKNSSIYLSLGVNLENTSDSCELKTLRAYFQNSLDFFRKKIHNEESQINNNFVYDSNESMLLLDLMVILDLNMKFCSYAIHPEILLD